MPRWPEPDPGLPFPQRFWSLVDPSGDCWIWKAAKDRLGYGSWSGKTPREIGESRPHRIAWTILVGPIPIGYWIDHLCRNPSCCNPDHLEPVPPRVNIQRGKNVGRPLAAHCRLGHPLAGANLYVKPSGERQCRICKRANWRKWKSGESPPSRSFPLVKCKRGHDYADTAYIDPKGRRHCKACRAYLQRQRRSVST